MIFNKANAASVRERLGRWFPDREFFMRSQGQVRFIKLSSRMQMAGAGLVVAVLLAWAGTMAAVTISQFLSRQDRLSLLEREAKVESAENRMAAYRDDLDAVADDLKRRQDVIEELTETLDLPTPGTRQGGKVSDSAGEAAKTVSKVSAAFPEAAALAGIEARQLAYVERLTRFADARAARAATALRKLGLNPDGMLASAQLAQGGPLEIVSTGRDGSLDPRFERLGLSLARMEALESGLEGVPQFLPADWRMISSGFGFRRDPFTGQGAMHAGLDFRGAIGTPIHAAAKGRISFVGQRSGYGNVVEISHGNGLMTRYAHMSAFHAKMGQKIEAGDVIGAIGSTGRSTGPHLHFEVRINGRAVNPRPFLETAPHVLEEARGGTADPTTRTR